MQYHQYSVEDFIKDEYFKSWVKAPTPESDQFWKSWLTQHPEKRAIVEEARQTIRLIDFERHELTAEDQIYLWQAIQREKVRPYTPTYRKTSTKTRAFPQPQVWFRWAAAFAALLICSAIFYQWLRFNGTQKYITDFGETQIIQLPDGSTVTLNANSHLSFSSSWDAHTPREVWLEGEAFFSVIKKANPGTEAVPGNAKFIVHTENVQVEVLGTEFNVSNRRQATRVILSSGQVKLNIESADTPEPLIMQPGESVEFSSVNKQIVKQAVDPEQYTAWRNKKLVFDNTPLAEVARTIEDTYGLKVHFEDHTQAGRKIRGTIPTDDMDILLAALSNTLNVQVVKDKDRIIIKKQ